MAERDKRSGAALVAERDKRSGAALVTERDRAPLFVELLGELEAFPQEVIEAPAGSVLPAHRRDGTLPPHVGERLVIAHPCSPYPVLLGELIERFGETPKRQELLRGLIRLRRQARALGMRRGFQWIGGSFIERPPTPREPNDLDVATFFVLPAPWRDRPRLKRLIADNPQLFRPTIAKQTFGCDAYFIPLRMSAAGIRKLALWQALFSHDRQTLRWKGFLELSLHSDDDDEQAWDSLT